MANLRFPSNALGDNKPFILFSTHKARYNTVGSKVNTVPTNNSVALYLPTNYNVNDALQYETEATGLIGAGFDAVASGKGGDITMSDVKNVVEGTFTNKEAAAKAAGAISGGLSAVAGARIGALAAALATGGVVGNVAAELSKQAQLALNPRQFMLFKSPGIRQFSFNFTFIPSNEQEVRDVPEIIKFFRRASYPELHSANTTYNFPEAFNINFGNSNKLIKLPEVFCTTISTTYNPNSMSYFEVDNLPVEINLNLSFQELQPIHRGFVDQGF